MKAVCSFIRRCLQKKVPQLATTDSEWEKRNKKGRCGSCNTRFTSNNPDFGGGQCMGCWASWG